MKIKSKRELAFFVDADLASHGISNYNWRLRFTNHLVWYQICLRRMEYWSGRSGAFGKLGYALSRLRHRRLSEKYGFTIPGGVFGPGLALVHRGTVVVHKNVVAGKNCRIHQGVTIGSVRGKAPVLGDNVWIAAGAAVLGDIRIGDRVAIAANAVVTKDVPSGVTVGGVPARVLNDSSSDEWIIDGHGAAAAKLGLPA